MRAWHQEREDNVVAEPSLDTYTRLLAPLSTVKLLTQHHRSQRRDQEPLTVKRRYFTVHLKMNHTQSEPGT